MVAAAAAAGKPWPWQRAWQWWLQRLPERDSWALTQRNIYILPTKGGVAFAFTLLLMLVSSINYQLNLGYVLTFLLAGAALVSMHLTHGTLNGLTLHLRPIGASFAGEPVLLEVVISNDGKARHGVGLRLAGRIYEHMQSWCDVPALGQASARISFVPPRRGWHAAPTLVVETRFPFGLFRAWSVWRPAARLLAYPQPESPAPPLPRSGPARGEGSVSHPAQGGELEGVRAWRRGDALRQVAWKKVARTGEMVSRESAAAVNQELWLDWMEAAAGSGGGDREARLSRLAGWVRAADQHGLVHGLRLPGREFPPGQGAAHRRRLLEALALWP